MSHEHKTSEMKSQAKGSCARWLWRFVRPLFKFGAAVAFVAVHHMWFGVGTRGLIQSGIDGIFLMAFTYGLAWLMRPGPNS